MRCCFRSEGDLKRLLIESLLCSIFTRLFYTNVSTASKYKLSCTNLLWKKRWMKNVCRQKENRWNEILVFDNVKKRKPENCCKNQENYTFCGIKKYMPCWMALFSSVSVLFSSHSMRSVDTGTHFSVRFEAYWKFGRLFLSRLMREIYTVEMKVKFKTFFSPTNNWKKPGKICPHSRSCCNSEGSERCECEWWLG